MKRVALLAALIVYGSLYPWRFEWHTPASPLDVLLNSWPTGVDRPLLRDAALNVLIYMPLGLAVFLAVARRHPRTLAFATASLLGLALSTTMEVLQVYVPGRVPSLLDITTNFAGTVAGAVVGLAMGGQVDRLFALRPRKLATAAALLLVCWATSQAFPFFPTLHQNKLQAALAILRHGFPLAPAEVWADGAEWFAAALALCAIFGRLRWWWPAVALCVLLSRMLIATRAVAPVELAGLLLAAVLWLAIPDRWRLGAGVCGMAAALVLRELAPFHFSPLAQPFTWIPFQGTLDSERESAVVILARKAFDYGAMVWLMRKCGVGYWRAGAVVAAGLLLFEFLQTHLPGRTPEISDSVLTLLMVVAMWRIDQF